MSKLAKIVPKPKGAYSASVTYNSLDIVRNSGKSWICKQDNVTGVTPADGAYWMMIAQDGSGTDTDYVTVGTASSTTVEYEAVVINGTYNIVGGTMCMTQTLTLSASADTDFVFTNSVLTTDSEIDVWFSEPKMGYKDIDLVTGSCTVTVERQDEARQLECKIYIR